MTQRAPWLGLLIFIAISSIQRGSRAAESAPIAPSAPLPSPESVNDVPQTLSTPVVSATPSEAGLENATDQDAAPVSTMASTGTEAAGAPEPPRRHWYGSETLATDGFALTCAFGATVGGPAVGAVAIATYALGGPIVHAAHGRWGAAAGSFALRVGLPVTLALIGHEGDQCEPSNDSEMCGAGGPALGFLLGIGAAIAIDSAVLAREEVGARPKTTSALRLTPIIEIDSKRAFLGVAGAF